MNWKWKSAIVVGLLAVASIITAANTPGMRLARGFIFRGDASNVGAAYDANGSGNILVGDGTDLVSVAVSGDVTLAASGAVTMAANAIVTGDITDGTITADDLGADSVSTSEIAANGVAADEIATGAVGTLEIAANVVVSADLNQNVMQVSNTQLTNAQLLALRAVPISLIASPGANTSIVVHKVCMVMSAAGGAYTESDDNLAIEFAGGTDIVNVDMTDAFDDAAVTARCYIPSGEQLMTVLAAANTACSTTCGGLLCMAGMDDAAGYVACGSAAADSCLCGYYATPTAATAVQAINTGSGEWGGGNAANTLSIRIWYSHVPTIAFSSGG